MPLYEYKCEACGHRLEALQQVSEPPLTKCPECGGELKKLLSAPAFQFKGSGWYVTDYGGKSNGGRTEAGGGKDSGEKASGDSGESKAAKGSDSKATGSTGSGS